MKFDTSTLSPRKHQAIAALIAHSDAQAASICGISTQMLGRWKKDPLFDAALRAARRAEFRHQKARLRQGALAAVVSLAKVVCNHTAKASDRLNAAKAIAGLAEYAVEMADFVAEVAELEAAPGGASPEVVSLPAGESAKPRRTGHGAKFPRKKQQAIIQLFKQPSIAKAAEETGIGTQTLYQWMDEPEFDAELRAVVRSAFGKALTLAQQNMPNAITLIKNFSGDPAVPEATRIKAAAYIQNDAKANAEQDLRARLSEQERARGSADSNEPAEPSKTIGRDLRRRLRRLKALFPGMGYGEFVYIHAVDGRATGSSVIGPEGWPVWTKPPAGSEYKVGERVPEGVAA